MRSGESGVSKETFQVKISMEEGSADDDLFVEEGVGSVGDGGAEEELDLLLFSAAFPSLRSLLRPFVVWTHLRHVTENFLTRITRRMSSMMLPEGRGGREEDLDTLWLRVLKIDNESGRQNHPVLKCIYRLRNPRLVCVCGDLVI